MRITEAHDYDLVGELVDAPEQLYTPAAQLVGPFPILPSGSNAGRSIAVR
jgi:hypothetical protein